MTDKRLIGAVEAGGTKMVCATGYADGTIVDRVSLPTKAPEETVAAMYNWFDGRGIEALGLAAFGPTGVNPHSPSYGHILQTPKVAWRGFDFLGAMSRRLGVPVGYDTDVNGACLGEVTYGSAKGLDAVVYVTVGTGIGAGVYLDGHLLHGMLHPEAGHIMLRREPGDDFEGTCPTHGTCFEGLAAGPANLKRFGVSDPAVLDDDPRFLDLESSYIAQGLAVYVLCYSPQRIVLGGGVPDHAPKLLPLVHKKVLGILNGYIQTPELENIDSYIVAPSCGGNQGILGAIALGTCALQA